MWAGFDVSCDTHVSGLCFRVLLIECRVFFVSLYLIVVQPLYRILHLTLDDIALSEKYNRESDFRNSNVNTERNWLQNHKHFQNR